MSYNNFTVRDEPFGLITKDNIQQIADTQFYAISNAEKIIQDDRTVMGSYDGIKSRFFAANSKNVNVSGIGVADASVQEFLAAAGKGKLCKAAGLTGAEKRACKKNVKNICGRKPLFGRAKKEGWLKCAEGAVVTPEQAAKEAAEALVPPSEERKGLGTGAIVMISVAALGFIALVGFALAGKRRPAVQPMARAIPAI